MVVVARLLLLVSCPSTRRSPESPCDALATMAEARRFRRLAGLDMWTNTLGFSLGTLKHGKTNSATFKRRRY